MKLSETWKRASRAYNLTGWVPSKHNKSIPAYVMALVLFFCMIIGMQLASVKRVHVPFLESEVVHDTTHVTVRDTVRMYNTDCDTVFIVDGMKFKKED